MKIVMLVSRRQKRGAEISAANLSRQLLAMGHTVIWTGLYSPGRDILEIENAITVDLPGSEKNFLNIKKCRSLIQLLRYHDADILQANGSDTFRYAVAAALFYKKIKIVYRNISKVSFWMGSNHLKKRFYSLLFRRADAVASVGTTSAQDFAHAMPVTKNKVKVIRRGIPAKPLNKECSRKTIFKQFGLNDQQHLLLWAGALSPEKNPSLLIEIMHLLNAKRNDCVLIVAGKGKEEDNLLSLIEQKQMKNVIMAGYQNNVHQLMAAADLLLLTSFVEGVPGIVLEAGVQYTPAIAVNTGGVSEAIRHMETGVLLNDHNGEAFANSIQLLLNDSHLRIRMGQAAAAYVAQEFDEVHNAASFHSLYLSLTQQ